MLLPHTRRTFLAGSAAAFAAVLAIRNARAETLPGLALVRAAQAQIGVTHIYDSSYVRLDYPNGDVPMDRGVCTDVIIRAYRKAWGYDLQKAVHEDMKRAFSAYPRIWGMRAPDANIDHRRVPNLQTFFKRQNASVPISANISDYQSGDVVSQMLPGNRPHILIVSDRISTQTQRPLVIHNIGAGTQEEDLLTAFPITGHYRFSPA